MTVYVCIEPKEKFEINELWIRRWQVISYTNINKSYTVGLLENGEFKCSCPFNVLGHKECKHIKQIKAMLKVKEIKNIEKNAELIRLLKGKRYEKV